MPSPITITDKTVDSVLITDDQSLVAYNGVTVADTSTVSDTETVSNQTTGQTAVEAGTPYTGPVAGLTSEFIDLSPDNLNIATITPNTVTNPTAGMSQKTARRGRRRFVVLKIAALHEDTWY
jgi:hypothetical protein